MHRRVVAALAGSALILLASALPASAHVTVNPNEAAKGGFAELSFRVPTESATASTVKVPTVAQDDGTDG